MPKSAVFTMKLDSDLRDDFLAAAEASHRTGSQVVRELMREFVQRQQDQSDYSAFVRNKVETARASVQDDRGRTDAVVEAAFKAGRARVTDAA